MTFDLSSIIWLFFALMLLQPLFTGRWFDARRAQAIRAIERSHRSRVITMIHRQEKRSMFGFALAPHIDMEDAQSIIAAIKDTPEDMPIDFVLHTPGGLVLAAMQIARAIEAHKAKVTVYVPVYAMSGGTLMALAADEIALGEFSVLGPIDPQIAGLPAASIVKARDSKPIEHVSDLTLGCDFLNDAPHVLPGGVDLAKKPNFAASFAVSNGDCVPRLRHIDSDKDFCMLLHGSPSCVRIGSAIPSNPRNRSVGRAASASKTDMRSYSQPEAATASPRFPSGEFRLIQALATN